MPGIAIAGTKIKGMAIGEVKVKGIAYGGNVIYRSTIPNGTNMVSALPQDRATSFTMIHSIEDCENGIQLTSNSWYAYNHSSQEYGGGGLSTTVWRIPKSIGYNHETTFVVPPANYSNIANVDPNGGIALRASFTDATTVSLPGSFMFYSDSSEVVYMWIASIVSY